MASDASILDQQLAGLDALELLGEGGEPSRLAMAWSRLWPKLSAIALVLFAWQAVVWLHLKPPYLLPGPTKVLPHLFDLVQTNKFWEAIARTFKRSLVGYSLAVAVGSVLGAAVSRVALLRAAFGSMITGLQTMPSIAWFPFAILLFQLSERAILFVVILGAAPSIANGLISGVDHTPPLLLRAGRMLGASRYRMYRHVILPASLPSYVAGLKQGWAFAWRSLMAGELLVILGPSVGSKLQAARDFNDQTDMMAWMLVILILGIIADTAFGFVDHRIREQRGLLHDT